MNGVGSIIGMAINMVVSYFFLKHFQSLANSSPSAPKKPKSDFSQFRNPSPVADMPVDPWAYDPTMGYGYGYGYNMPQIV